MSIDNFTQQIASQLHIVKTKWKEENMSAIEQALKNAIKTEDEEEILSIIEHFEKKTSVDNRLNCIEGIDGLLTTAKISQSIGGATMMERYAVEITDPIIQAIKNEDHKIRIRALEGLLVMSKCFSETIIICLPSIVENMILQPLTIDSIFKSRYQKKLDAANEHLTIHLRNLLIFSNANPNYFNQERFLTVLTRFISEEQEKKCFLILFWINVLLQIERINMLQYLSDMFQGLIRMASKQNIAVRESAIVIVLQFLQRFQQLPQNPDLERSHFQLFETIIQTFTIVASDGEELSIIVTIQWIHEYLNIAQTYLDRIEQQLKVTPTSHLESIASLVKNKQLFLSQLSCVGRPVIELITSKNPEIKHKAEQVVFQLLTIKDSIHTSITIITFRQSTNEQIIQWILSLPRMYQDDQLPHIDGIIDILIELLAQASGRILQMVLKSLSRISINPKFEQLVIDNLIIFFYQHRTILNTRGSYIFQILCQSVDPSRFYVTLCVKLKQCGLDHDFISEILWILNQLLITAEELKNVRSSLRFHDLNSETDRIELFTQLFKSCVLNPITAINLCFLGEQYELAYSLLLSFSEVEIDERLLGFLTQLADLLHHQNYIFLRQSLKINPNANFLVQSFLALMMMLPQEREFHKLNECLQFEPFMDEDDNCHLEISQMTYCPAEIPQIDHQQLLAIYQQSLALYVNGTDVCSIKQSQQL